VVKWHPNFNPIYSRIIMCITQCCKLVNTLVGLHSIKGCKMLKEIYRLEQN